MPRLFAIALPLAALLFANAALADSHDDKLRRFLPAVESAFEDEGVVRTLQNYNEMRREMTEADIDGWEAIWQAELGSNNRPLITGVVRNITALRMGRVMRETGRVIVQINLLDARGVSVAQTEILPTIRHAWAEQLMSAATVSPGMVRVGELDASRPGAPRRFEAIVPIADPETGAPIGTAVLVIDADALDARYPDRSF